MWAPLYSSLSPSQISTLTEWLKKNLDNPYLTHSEKQDLAARTGLDPLQINSWLVNSRKPNGLLDRLRAERDTVRSVSPLETLNRDPLHSLQLSSCFQ